MSNDHEAGKVSRERLALQAIKDRLQTAFGAGVWEMPMPNPNGPTQDDHRRAALFSIIETCDKALTTDQRDESQESAVRVKALEWDTDLLGADELTAWAPFGEYHIRHADGRFELRLNYASGADMFQLMIGSYERLGDAQAVAQADNYRRVHYALEPTPIKETASPAVPADVQGVTDGPYEARYCKGIPADVCDYGVISTGAGIEVCRVWKEADARAIAAALSDCQRLAAENERVIEGLNRQLTEQFELSTKYVALHQAAEGKLGALVAEASFLLDRLDDFERGGFADDIENAVCEFEGHVSPAFQRLRASLTSPPTEQGET